MFDDCTADVSITISTVIVCPFLGITIVRFKFDLNHLGVSLSHSDTEEVNRYDAMCMVDYTIDDTGGRKGRGIRILS